MKYLKTIDLRKYEDAITSGQIKLQRGQWVQIGSLKSRFVGVKNNCIWASHDQGNKTATRKRFIDLCEAFRAF